MDHLYMEAMMRGEFARKKNMVLKNKEERGKEERSPEERSQFEIVLDKEIDNYVDAMEIEEDPSHQDLLSPTLRREKIKTELKTAIRMEDLSQLIESAVKLLLAEGANDLSQETYKLLISDFSDAYTRISKINLEQASDLNISALAHLSNESLEAIAVIAIDKFSKELYYDSLSLFSLLAIINPGHAEYWFRMAIAAQKFGNLELATRAYATTIELDSKHIGARLFAAECYAMRNLKDEANAEFAEAKKIAANNKTEKIWLDVLSAVQSFINE